jgi:hypothetical protein
MDYEISTENLSKTVINKLSDDDLLSNALRFAFAKCPTDERGALVDFQKYKSTFYGCMKWLRDNYEPVCDGFLGEVETK